MEAYRLRYTTIYVVSLLMFMLMAIVATAEEACVRPSIQKIREIKSKISRASHDSDWRLDREPERTSFQEEYIKVQPVREKALSDLREIVKACYNIPVVLQAYELYYDNDLGLSWYIDDFAQDFADILGPDSDPIMRKYVIGDEWNGEVLLPLQLEQAGLLNLAKSVFQTDGTVSFYGKIAGEYVFVTNHHVISGNSKCIDQKLTSPFFRKDLECKEVIAVDMGTDFSMFTVKQDTDGAMDILNEIEKNGLRFDFRALAPTNTPLMFIGYGSYRRRSMNKAAGWFQDWDNDLPMVKRSEECRVFDAGVKQLLNDPDLTNPATDYSVPAQPIGCEVAHGDSGSSILNRNTGRVTGLVATIATPYPYRSDEEIRNISGAAIWDYSMLIPAVRIAEFLQKEAKETKSPLAQKIILELLERDSR